MKREKLNGLLDLSESELDAMALEFERDTWNRSEYGRAGAGRPAAFREAMRPVTFKETPPSSPPWTSGQPRWAPCARTTCAAWWPRTWRSPSPRAEDALPRNAAPRWQLFTDGGWD